MTGTLIANQRDVSVKDNEHKELTGFDKSLLGEQTWPPLTYKHSPSISKKNETDIQESVSGLPDTEQTTTS